VKERPILMSAPMVRACLREKDPKTQTRRIIKIQPPGEGFRMWTCMSTTGERRNVGRHHWVKTKWNGDVESVDEEGPYFTCPYCQPGDRLWVRETTSESEPCFLGGKAQPTVWYRADNNRPMWADRKWTPSILSPRRLSRITLEITKVRIERLNDISGDDVVAEGIRRPPAMTIVELSAFAGTTENSWLRNQYLALWQDINGPGSWDKNPWVWVVEFKRIQP
jgi:hypothetical protein